MNIQLILRIFLLSFFCHIAMMSAQELKPDGKDEKNNSIIEELNSDRPAQGRVMVYQDEAIKGVLAKPIPPKAPVYTSSDGATRYMKMRGYKIQVFSGNNQRKSKNEAYNKQKIINDKYADIETVVYFKSPRWILRAGNFKTREEANNVLKEFVKSFPSFGKEMYIISDIIKVPL